MSRPRIIKDIETFDQALKAERDVESGYHRVIDEHISYLIAVEEDIIESYAKLIASTDDVKIKAVLAKIIDDSRKRGEMLRAVSESFRKIMLDEEEHAKLLRRLAEGARSE